MKKILFYILSAMFLFSSCSSEDKETIMMRKDLVGTWIVDKWKSGYSESDMINQITPYSAQCIVIKNDGRVYEIGHYNGVYFIFTGEIEGITGCIIKTDYSSYKELGDINTTSEGDPYMTVHQFVEESLSYDSYGAPPFDYVSNEESDNSLVVEYIDENLQGFWIRDPEDNYMLHYSKQDDYYLLRSIPLYKENSYY